MTLFVDRHDAGRRLAARLAQIPLDHPLVLALVRGGVPVAHGIAQTLDAPMDIVLVRKLGVPGQDELAMGAIATGGARILNTEVVSWLSVTDDQIEAVTRREQKELLRRERLYRGSKPPLNVTGRTAILVDDGLATGATMRAAAMSLREKKPRAIIGAVPVGSASGCSMVGERLDEMICLEQPPSFRGVGAWYRDFTQVTDAEVRRLLGSAAAREELHHAQA